MTQSTVAIATYMVRVQLAWFEINIYVVFCAARLKPLTLNMRTCLIGLELLIA